MTYMIKFAQIFSLILGFLAAPALAQDATQQQLQINPQVLQQLRQALPTVRPAGENTFSAIDLPLEIGCSDSCLCKGAGDCVKLATNGCCGSSDITCNDSGCSCVNNGGCDSDGNMP